MTAPAEVPAPGSTAADTQGCVCSGMTFAGGRAAGDDVHDAEGRTVYVTRLDCPVHGWDAL